MENKLKLSVIMSILSSPGQLNLWDSVDIPPYEKYRRLKISEKNTQQIIAEKYSKDPDKASDLIIERCLKRNIRIVTIWDDEYPPLLKEIYNPPFVIYSLREIPQKKMISIVGTRDSDEKSQEVTRKISGIISREGYTIVSGMAIGIDRCAHLGALMAEGSTIAVLPGGVDVIYPYKNCDIYKKIKESPLCAIISEYPPGIGIAQKWTFVRRNRIISGMSQALIVTQAPLKSGAMITAKYAIEQNRELFVCPGNAFDSKYSGCNELIRQGAIILSEMKDFFHEIDPDHIGYKNGNNVNSVNFENSNLIKTAVNNETKSDLLISEKITGIVEIKIIEELKNGIIEIDNFIRKNGFSAEEVNQGVTILEITGHICRKGNIICRG